MKDVDLEALLVGTIYAAPSRKESYVEKAARIRRMRQRYQGIINDYVSKLEKVPEEVKRALSLIEPIRSPNGTRQKAVIDNYLFLSTLMREKKSWTALELFQDFGFTPSDMTAKRRSAFRFAPEPRERIWMSYDRDYQVYKFMRKGPTPPVGYYGPYPLDYIEGETDAQYEARTMRVVGRRP